MMASALPAVPLLLGPSNLDHWSDVLQTLFHYEDLDGFVFEEPSPRIEDAYRGHPEDYRAILFIKASLEKVRPWLLAAGWKPEMQSAHYHYNFIMSQVPKMDSAPEEAQDNGEETGEDDAQNQEMPSFRDAHRTVQGLMGLKQGEDESYASYRIRILGITHQLKHAGVDTLEKLQSLIAVNGLKEGDVKDLETKTLDDHLLKHTPASFWRSMMYDLSVGDYNDW